MSTEELRMVLMWEARQDTWEIAKVLRVPEHAVYNALPMLRTIRRRERETSSS